MIKNIKQKGFTLIEIIVATAIFTIVMLVALGAVLNAVDANRKAQNINIIINNLNLAVESMIRDLRTGRQYGPCGASVDLGYQCVTFTDKDGNAGVRYRIRSDATGRYLEKDPSSMLGSGRITSTEVRLDDVATFTFEGLDDNDGPERILVQVKGSTGSGKTQSAFNIQTLITSRIFDAVELE